MAKKITVNKFRDRVAKIVFEAETPAGKAYDVLLLILIAVSVGAVMLESVDKIKDTYHYWLLISEYVFTAMFALEYFTRIWLTRHPFKYAKSFFGIVDLLSWLPSLLVIFCPGIQSLLVIRVLRLLRMFRILKMVRYVHGANIIMDGLRASRAKIIVFFLTVLLFSVIVGTVTYLIEAPRGSGFDNIPVSIYWAIVTMTTLGYGDIAPTSVVGQMIAAFTVLTGYAIIAVPTGIVSAEMISAAHKPLTDGGEECPKCGEREHHPKAMYCHKCGEELPAKKATWHA